MESTIGELDLKTLLLSMQPAMRSESFVFCTGDKVHGDPIFTFKEEEGWTMVLPKEDAERLGIDYTYVRRAFTFYII